MKVLALAGLAIFLFLILVYVYTEGIFYPESVRERLSIIPTMKIINGRECTWKASAGMGCGSTCNPSTWCPGYCDYCDRDETWCESKGGNYEECDVLDVSYCNECGHPGYAYVKCYYCEPTTTTTTTTMPEEIAGRVEIEWLGKILSLLGVKIR